jgi:hypothetical protein
MSAGNADACIIAGLALPCKTKRHWPCDFG